jgi:hypothetical protein
MISVKYGGWIKFPKRQVEAFEKAAARWNRVIKTRPGPVQVPQPSTGVRTVEGLEITAELQHIDGVGSTLAMAGPTHIRRDGPHRNIPCLGIMRFDTADMDDMEQNGTLDGVILHEMAHVVGFGTLFQLLYLVQGRGGSNPVFIGKKAMEECAKLMQWEVPRPVPLADTGGPGTHSGHWRESIFGDELMTGYVDMKMPLSRMSIAAFEDMGYDVDYSQADEFQTMSLEDLVFKGVLSSISEIPIMPREQILRPTPISV